MAGYCNYITFPGPSREYETAANQGPGHARFLPSLRMKLWKLCQATNKTVGGRRPISPEVVFMATGAPAVTVWAGTTFSSVQGIWRTTTTNTALALFRIDL